MEKQKRESVVSRNTDMLYKCEELINHLRGFIFLIKLRTIKETTEELNNKLNNLSLMYNYMWNPDDIQSFWCIHGGTKEHIKEVRKDLQEVMDKHGRS